MEVFELDCGKCFFSTMIDGSLWCCIVDEDIAFDQEKHEYVPSENCEDYVAVDQLNRILKEYSLKIKDKVDDDLKEFIEERIDHFGG